MADFRTGEAEWFLQKRPKKGHQDNAGKSFKGVRINPSWAHGGWNGCRDSCVLNYELSSIISPAEISCCHLFSFDSHSHAKCYQWFVKWFVKGERFEDLLRDYSKQRMLYELFLSSLESGEIEQYLVPKMLKTHTSLFITAVISIEAVSPHRDLSLLNQTKKFGCDTR